MSTVLRQPALIDAAQGVVARTTGSRANLREIQRVLGQLANAAAE